MEQMEKQMIKMELVNHLPYSMRNLKLLLHLTTCRYGISTLHAQFLERDVKLTYVHFPCRLHDKVNIELDNLVNLETLECFSTNHGRVMDLSGMTRLRALCILEPSLSMYEAEAPV